MKWIFICLLFMLCQAGKAQQTQLPAAITKEIRLNNSADLPQKEEVKLSVPHWRVDRNKVVTGGLVLLAGLSKGFNETLQFHWKAFQRKFPRANPQWFNPAISWKNKYRNGDPNQGPKSFLSTSALIGFTDQYHLNNMVNRLSWTGALVINISGGKKPLKHYLLDLVYYSACNYTGFAAAYYSFRKPKRK